MKNTTETMTAEQIINQVSVLDIPEFRADLRKMMDQHFLHCASVGNSPEPYHCAFIAVDSLLKGISELKQAEQELKKVA